MAILTLGDMRAYLRKSLASGKGKTVNKNKINGLLAEIAFRRYITDLGFANQVSPGGWIVRTKGPGIFGQRTIVFFPETILPGVEYRPGREPVPNQALHTICATFHQLGIHSYYCIPSIQDPEDVQSLEWKCIQLGVPAAAGYKPFPLSIDGFTPRENKYKWLRHNTDASVIPDNAVSEEFSKEHVRITFFDHFFGEVSDIDGVFWGQNKTYPVEIKEKTAGKSEDMGDYFGLDIGPFVKLAYFAAKRGQMHSLFVVHEIEDEVARQHRDWWFITFDRLALFASWNQQAGGRNMAGGRSAVVRIPKSEFCRLDKTSLDAL